MNCVLSKLSTSSAVDAGELYGQLRSLQLKSPVTDSSVQKHGVSTCSSKRQKINLIPNYPRFFNDINTLPKAVIVRNLLLTYRTMNGRVFVLNDASIHVPQGAIYGLLGPSGCGKTTMLKCLMGLKKPDQGLIRVFGYPVGTSESGIPGHGVGYMPQEVALQEDLTVRETWTYFGRISFMSEDEIEKRIKEISSMLDLDQLMKRLVCNLSGGQKRRVSFGATILHRPRIMVLDEPTVGVDPLLRSRIWQELLVLTRVHKVTVIITTHYIEEARQADLVGFMRKGAILTESSPNQLLEKYKAESLEKVFLKLCYEQQNQSSHAVKPILDSKTEMTLNRSIEKFPMKEVVNSPKLGYFWWWQQFRAIYRKYLLQLVRQPETLIAAFVLPILILQIFCICVGSTPTGLKVGIINHEYCGEIFMTDCLSNHFVDQIDSYVFTKETYSNLSQAIEDVQRKKLWAAVEIKDGFSEALRAKVAFSETDVLGKRLDINDSLIRVHADLTELLISVTMEQSLLDAYQKTLAMSTVDHPRLGDLPIALVSSIFGTFSKSDFFGVRDFAGPGLMIIIVFSVSFALTAFSLLLEKKDRTLNRNFAAGVSRLHVVLATISTRSIFTMLGSTVLMILSVQLFEIPCRGSLPAALMLLILQTISGMSLGIFMASISRSMFVCCALANGYLIFTFIMSGVLWSVETLPYYLRWFSAIQPTTQAAESLRSIMIRGLSVSRYNVFMGFITSFVWIIIFLVLSINSLKIQDD